MAQARRAEEIRARKGMARHLAHDAPRGPRRAFFLRRIPGIAFTTFSMRHDDAGMHASQLRVRAAVLLQPPQRVFLLLKQLLERADALAQRLLYL
jgi:hypothetical protein